MSAQPSQQTPPVIVVAVVGAWLRGHTRTFPFSRWGQVKSGRSIPNLLLYNTLSNLYGLEIASFWWRFCTPVPVCIFEHNRVQIDRHSHYILFATNLWPVVEWMFTFTASDLTQCRNFAVGSVMGKLNSFLWPKFEFLCLKVLLYCT